MSSSQAFDDTVQCAGRHTSALYDSERGRQRPYSVHGRRVRQAAPSGDAASA